MSIHYIKIKRIFKKRKLSKKINLNDNIKIYIRSASDLSFLTFLNNNDNKLIAQFNYI